MKKLLIGILSRPAIWMASKLDPVETGLAAVTQLIAYLRKSKSSTKFFLAVAIIGDLGQAMVDIKEGLTDKETPDELTSDEWDKIEESFEKAAINVRHLKEREDETT